MRYRHYKNVEEILGGAVRCGVDRPCPLPTALSIRYVNFWKILTTRLALYGEARLTRARAKGEGRIRLQ